MINTSNGSNTRGQQMLQQREVWVDYLRSAITVLVVAHHSMLAYTSFASFDPVAYIRSTHPVVDSARWAGLDVLVNFNDIFFMSLMFLIGGFFVSDNIKRKGPGPFLRDRFFRLFLPFIIGGTLLMLLAYFPAWIRAHDNYDLIAYVKDFFLVEQWPVGPPWFIWVLFLFNLVAAVTSNWLQKFHLKMGKIIASLARKPIRLFLFVFITGWLLYVPVAYNTGADTWTGFGPFDFQLSRFLLYFGYFQIGIWIGNTRFNDTIFSKAGNFTSSWPYWGILAVLIFVCLTVSNQQQLLSRLAANGTLTGFEAWMGYYSMYMLSCTASCFAMLALFRRFAGVANKRWQSLSENAYLVYLLHFVFVTWIQYLLLDLMLHAVLKFLVTFLASTILSWIVANQLRRIRFIRRYL